MKNKSAPIPKGTRPKIERFLRRLGYRLVLRQAQHKRQVRAGAELSVAAEFDHVGVAPPYREQRLALRLRGQGRTCSRALEPSVRGWLPGPPRTELRWPIPSNLPPGRYDLDLGIVGPSGQTPEVRLANTGRGPDGWYPIGPVEVGP